MGTRPVTMRSSRRKMHPARKAFLPAKIHGKSHLKLVVDNT